MRFAQYYGTHGQRGGRMRSVFVGCGDGGEIAPLAGDADHLIVGLEPIEVLFSTALGALSGFPNVVLRQERIQDWDGGDFLGTIDQVFFVFPKMQLITYQSEEVVPAVSNLLREGCGRLFLCTEVLLSGWPDGADQAALERFLPALEAEGFSITVDEVPFSRLPPLVCESGCGRRFRAHGIKTITVVEGVKARKEVCREGWGQTGDEDC